MFFTDMNDNMSRMFSTKTKLFALNTIVNVLLFQIFY